LGGIADPNLRLRLLIQNQLTYIVDNMTAIKVLSHEAGSLWGEYLQRVNAKKRHITMLASGILQELSPAGKLDPRVATFALFVMMNWLYNWYRPGRDATLERLGTDLTDIFLFGFLAAGKSIGMEELVTTAGSPKGRAATSTRERDGWPSPRST